MTEGNPRVTSVHRKCQGASTIALIVLFSLCGCAHTDPAYMASGAVAAETGPTKNPEGAAAPASAPLSLNQQILAAREDLAARLGLAPDLVTLSGARPVNWRSGALGCPQPGMSYTDVLVPGALIYLRANGEVYGYHARQGGEPFYCPRERAEKPVFGRGADMT